MKSVFSSEAALPPLLEDPPAMSSCEERAGTSLGAAPDPSQKKNPHKKKTKKKEPTTKKKNTQHKKTCHKNKKKEAKADPPEGRSAGVEGSGAAHGYSPP